MSPGRWRALVCLLLGLGLASPHEAMAPTPAQGRVQGLVLDTTGQPLPGVLVEIEGDATPVSSRTESDGR